MRLFYQKPKFQLKFTRCAKKPGNHGPEEQNSPPKTTTKEMQIYELPDKESNIVILKIEAQ